MNEGTKSQSKSVLNEHEEIAVEAAIDIMLLSLIRAYPIIDEKTDGDRLTEARKSIFGIKSPRGRRKYNDLAIMEHMADDYIKDRGPPSLTLEYDLFWPDVSEDGVRSDTELATIAYVELVATGKVPIGSKNKNELVRTWQAKFAKNRPQWLRMAHDRGRMATDVLRMFNLDLRDLLSTVGIKTEEVVEPVNEFNRPI